MNTSPLEIITIIALVGVIGGVLWTIVSDWWIHNKPKFDFWLCVAWIACAGCVVVVLVSALEGKA